MDTRTGALRELREEEQPTQHEIPLTNRQARRLSMLSPADRVEWAALQSCTPAERNRRKRLRKLQRAARKLQR
jgi:hypothetical protein